MAKQRFKLGKFYGKPPQQYRATFGYLTHKVNQQHKKIPVILLKNIYIIDKDKKHLVADHMWVKLTKPWFKLGELLDGDCLIFKAKVEKYKISREDVLAKREAIWQEAVKTNNQIYQRWQKYTDTHHRKNFQLSLDKMKQKQKNNLIEAKKQQAKLELVDYSLNYISNLKLTRKNSDTTYEREQFDYDYYKKQGYKYSSWMAARSIDYAESHIKL